MSLGIAFKGPEGIVLAADSRVTLTAQLVQGERTMLLPATFDNATKLLRVKDQDFVGAVTYGAGALGTKAPRTAHSYLPEFENELASTPGRLAVEKFAKSLSDFFLKQWEAAEMPEEADSMIFLVGGFDEGSAYGRVFQVVIPTAPIPIEQNLGDNFGVTWGGQVESATRLLKGFDPGVFPAIQDILKLDEAAARDLQAKVEQVIGASTPIPYAFLPLQDCVDLAILLVRTTAALQSFAVGIRGVGGAIDVATITRTEGFKAIQQKTIEGERFDL